MRINMNNVLILCRNKPIVGIPVSWSTHVLTEHVLTEHRCHHRAPMSVDRVLRGTSLFLGRNSQVSAEQGIHAERIDMSGEQAAHEPEKGANPARFCKFPVKFPASRELRSVKARRFPKFSPHRWSTGRRRTQNQSIKMSAVSIAELIAYGKGQSRQAQLFDARRRHAVSFDR
jgi:hypothetical protein